MARPFPFWSRWMAVTPSSSSHNLSAITHVSSTLALSTMTMDAVNGKESSR